MHHLPQIQVGKAAILRSLPPATVKKVGSRTEKRWYLVDVIEHLKNPAPTQDLDLFMEDFKQMIGHKLFPAILDSKGFGGIIIGSCMDELGISKVQAYRIFELVTVALTYALSEMHEDDDMTYAFPDFVTEMGDLGIEAYLEKYESSSTGPN
jgi:hypothetical protein